MSAPPDEAEAERLAHVVIIPSAGRPAILAETVASLARQTVAPDLIVVCVPSVADAPRGVDELAGVRVVLSSRGSTVQRNAALAAVDRTPDLVTYLDDDIALRDDYFEHVRDFFRDRPDVALMTGLVVADGIGVGEISRPEARRALASSGSSTFQRDVRSAYGCNMTARGSVAALEPFDERMKLYAWQEDTDFSVRAGRHGRVVHYHGCVCVHLAVGSGRVNGRALGFAQVVNPFYMWRKGTKSAKELTRDWSRYLGSNAVGRLRRGRPDRQDRRGRLTGNVLGLREVVLHGGRPEAIETVARKSARAGAPGGG